MNEMSYQAGQKINDLEDEIRRLKETPITLRDQFAMAALNWVLKGNLPLKNAAECSYEIADAMMEARSNEQGRT